MEALAAPELDINRCSGNNYLVLRHSDSAAPRGLQREGYPERGVH